IKAAIIRHGRRLLRPTPEETPFLTALVNDSPSLSVMLLQIAKLEYPSLSISEELAKIGEIAVAVAPALDRRNAETLLDSFGRAMSKQGFEGNFSNYYCPKNSYLND